jgi:hypothetical protein
MAATYPNGHQVVHHARGGRHDPAGARQRPADEVTAIETQLRTGGSWTMTVVSTGGGVPTYTRQTGYYMRVGTLVFVQGYVTLLTKGTLAAGSISISGLPFTSKNQTDGYAAVNIPYWSNFTSSLAHLGGFINPNSTSIILVKLTAAATGTPNLADTDLANTSEFIFSAVYQV